MARMKDFYKETVAPALFKKFGYKSVMQIPKLDKIVVNVACGEAKENHKIIENVMSELAQITVRSRLSAVPRRQSLTSSSERVRSSVLR